MSPPCKGLDPIVYPKGTVVMGRLEVSFWGVRMRGWTSPGPSWERAPGLLLSQELFTCVLFPLKGAWPLELGSAGKTWRLGLSHCLKIGI